MSVTHASPIAQRLQTLAQAADWDAILLYLQSLSNAQFRTAGSLLGSSILPSLDEPQAWALALHLSSHHPRAFLVTVLKPLAQGVADRRLRLRSAGGRAFVAWASQGEEDRRKTLDHLLPVLPTPDDVLWLLRHLNVEDGLPRLAPLLRAATMPCAYVLVRALRYVEHDRPLLLRVARHLMQRGDSLGFNLASLLRAQHGLEQLRGTFSLHIEPYQLARLDSDYQAFCQAMRR